MTLNQISRQGKILLKLYNEYLLIKKKYLNYPKITEYLFNKPVVRKIKWQYDGEIKPVFMDPVSIPFLDIAVNNLLDTLLSFSTEYAKYLDMVNKYTNIVGKKLSMPNVKYLPIYADLGDAEKRIIKILESLKQKYQMDYVYKWDFVVNGIRSNNRQKYPINYSNDFVYDFFGQIIYDGKLILFVIEYCDDVTEQDIMKQHVLFQMNVHLLRLDKKSNILSEIKDFIKKIIATEKYVMCNGINHELDTDALNIFITEYKQNHIAFLKNPPPEDLPRYQEFDVNDLDDEPDEDAIAVKPDTVNKIVKKKIYLTNSAKNPLIEKMSHTYKNEDADILTMAIELVKKN